SPSSAAPESFRPSGGPVSPARRCPGHRRDRRRDGGRSVPPAPMNILRPTLRPGLLLPLAVAMLFPPVAAAAEHCDRDRLRASPPAVNFRVDNDLLGNGGQDQGYTNGALLTLVSPD